MLESGVCTSIAPSSFESARTFAIESSATREIIEIRLDAFETIPTIDFLAELRPASTLILTFRPREQGGLRDLSVEERLGFWNQISDNISRLDEKIFFDIELDILSKIRIKKDRVIGSLHDFNGDIPSKSEVIEEISRHAGTAKLAWTAESAEDALEVFKLLEHAGKTGVDLIPIAMGEPGKLSRILSVSKGAPFSYGSQSTLRSTAPGQIPANELRELYRIASIGLKTKVFGLIAGDTSYSLSPKIHNTIFADEQADAVFVPFQTRDVSTLIQRLNSDQFPFQIGGLAVTNPFKLDVIALADELDETATATKAVNTLQFQDGRILGFNTDVHGFISPLKRRLPDLKGSRVAILGTGGACRAAVTALLREDCDICVFGRDSAKLEDLTTTFGVETRPLSDDSYKEFRIVVNTTPLGTRGPQEHHAIAKSSQLGNTELAYDLVYNPSETVFLKEASAAGCRTLGGIQMLVDQALEQQRLWRGRVVGRERLLTMLSN
jgi:3-dehydroquinate dehydratase / shikimate dehydrogenase